MKLKIRRVIKLVGLLLGISFLLFQFSNIIVSRFTGNRYFVFAPHDIQVQYTIYRPNGKKVPNRRCQDKYGLRNPGWVDLPIQHVFDCIQDYHAYHPAEEAPKRLQIDYRINEGERKQRILMITKSKE